MLTSVQTLKKDRTYTVSTLYTPARVVSIENQPVSYDVNRTPVNVTVNQSGDPNAVTQQSNNW